MQCFVEHRDLTIHHTVKYSWLSLSRPRLSRITAYLEVEIWSLHKHENLTTGKKKYCGKEENLLLRSNFSSFPQYFQYVPNFRSQITYIFVKCGCSNDFFLQFCKSDVGGTDISKCFKESLGIRDNESRLYLFIYMYVSRCKYKRFVFVDMCMQMYFCLCICMSENGRHSNDFVLFYRKYAYGMRCKAGVNRRRRCIGLMVTRGRLDLYLPATRQVCWKRFHRLKCLQPATYCMYTQVSQPL